MDEKTAIVTGATSGIGGSAARKLHDRGYTVYGLGRRADRLEALAAGGIRTIAVDLTDADSVAAAVDRVVAETGRVDVLVNNAGYGALGAVEDASMDDGRRQFEVNVFSAIQLIQLVLPHMREQGSGRIVNVTSTGGKAHTPLGGWYHGTKFALEGMSDALRFEVKQFGIDVVVVEPGATATEWGSIAVENVLATSGHGAYKKQAEALAGSLRSETMHSRLTSADVVADTVVTAATTTRPRTRYAVGFGAKPTIAVRRLVSDRVFDAFVGRVFGVPRG